MKNMGQNSRLRIIYIIFTKLNMKVRKKDLSELIIRKGKVGTLNHLKFIQGEYERLLLKE